MHTIRRNPAYQQGASLYAIIVMMTMLGIIIFAGLKIAPAYIDNQIITTTVENMRESGELERMPLRELRSRINRTMQINNVNFDPQNINEVAEGGVQYIEVQYESRVDLFANIDAVVEFDYRIEK